MCLNKITNKKEITDTITEKGLKVYKVVEIRDGKYYPIYQHYTIPYKEGIDIAQFYKNISTKTIGFYKAGFHFFKTKKAADDYLKETHPIGLNIKLKVIICNVKKSWITATGTEIINKIIGRKYSTNVIVANKAVFPKFKED